jgi:choline dehydrogenase-like flavoprotein
MVHQRQTASQSNCGRLSIYTGFRWRVLDSDHRAYDFNNLCVTNGSFMRAGGSVPCDWTIYANAFHAADKASASEAEFAKVAK